MQISSIQVLLMVTQSSFTYSQWEASKTALTKKKDGKVTEHSKALKTKNPVLTIDRHSCSQHLVMLAETVPIVWYFGGNNYPPMYY